MDINLDEIRNISDLALIPVLSMIVYGFSMLRGKSKPERMTRFLFWLSTLPGLYNLISTDYDNDWRYSALLIIFSAMNLIIFLMSTKYGVGGKNLIDKACFLVAISLGGLSLALQDTSSIILANTLAASSLLVAFIPTFIKTWKRPSTEGSWFYIIQTLGWMLNISLISYMVLENLIFPSVMMLINLTMLIIINKTKVFGILSSTSSRSTITKSTKLSSKLT